MQVRDVAHEYTRHSDPFTEVATVLGTMQPDRRLPRSYDSRFDFDQLWYSGGHVADSEGTLFALGNANDDPRLKQLALPEFLLYG
jgi:hypothetical protein